MCAELFDLLYNRFECCVTAACGVQEHQLLFPLFSWALEVADDFDSALLAAGTTCWFLPASTQSFTFRGKVGVIVLVVVYLVFLSCFVVCRPSSRQLLIFIILNPSILFGALFGFQMSVFIFHGVKFVLVEKPKLL